MSRQNFCALGDATLAPKRHLDGGADLKQLAATPVPDEAIVVCHPDRADLWIALYHDAWGQLFFRYIGGIAPHARIAQEWTRFHRVLGTVAMTRRLGGNFVHTTHRADDETSKAAERFAADPAQTDAHRFHPLGRICGLRHRVAILVPWYEPRHRIPLRGDRQLSDARRHQNMADALVKLGHFNRL
jgi:hypothetical protein